MAEVAEQEAEKMNPLVIELLDDKVQKTLPPELVLKFEQAQAPQAQPRELVRDATLAMIGDALVRVSLKKLIKTQHAFQAALEAFVARVREVGIATGEAAQKLAAEAIQLADSFRVKLIHYGQEVYKAILLFRDRMVEAAKRAAEASAEALRRAKEAGVATASAVYEKLVIARDATAKALHAAIAQAIVLTALAGLFVAECIRVVRDAINEILDELMLLGKAAYARMVVLYNSVVEFVQQLQERLNAHMEKAKKARAERRVVMMKKLQAMKNDIYQNLMEELEVEEGL